MRNAAAINSGLFYYEIDYVDSAPSEAASEEIIRHLHKIQRLHDRVVSAHIAVRIPNKHHRKHFYHISIKLHVPGGQIVVNREPEKDFSHTDIKTAIHDAFQKAIKQLDGFVKHRRDGTRISIEPNPPSEPESLGV